MVDNPPMKYALKKEKTLVCEIINASKGWGHNITVICTLATLINESNLLVLNESSHSGDDDLQHSSRFSSQSPLLQYHHQQQDLDRGELYLLLTIKQIILSYI